MRALIHDRIAKCTLRSTSFAIHFARFFALTRFGRDNELGIKVAVRHTPCIRRDLLQHSRFRGVEMSDPERQNL
jgi:hypothetical protein